MTGRKAAIARDQQPVPTSAAAKRRRTGRIAEDWPEEGGPAPDLGADIAPALGDQFLRALLLNMSEAVVAIDSRGTILFFSPGSEQLLGYGAGETVGRNVSMLMAGADSARHDGHIHAYLQSGQSRIIGRSRQVTAVTKTGERIAVDLRVVAFELAGVRLFIGTMRDVRERVERELRLEAAKRQLAERNLQLRAILRSVSEGICLFDPQHRLITCNDRFLALFALGDDRIRRGTSFRDLIDLHMPAVREGADGVDDSRTLLLDLARRQSPGAIKLTLQSGPVLRVMLTPLPDGRLVVTVTDISDEEHASEKLRRALASERAASQAKSEFLANMNHELRTPLNAILGMTDAILHGYCGDLAARQREYLRDIHAAGEHLRNLIGEILDLSKIESGNFKLLRAHAAPEELMRECARMVDGLARTAGLSLKIEVAKEIGGLVVDARVMKQTILNLLSNAIKFTPGGGSVTLRLAPGESGGARIEVADTGIGMNTDEVATALSVFGQVENVMNRRHSGTGLGLPLARAFVELHGGSLRIESAPHAGTRVIIDLPPGCVA
ncbi:MAG TPA: ATP-binding protein [Alphaproteobacteria bacterium]|nr:ATP-binding protein [Alphaproteobacteria bacterium]